MAELRILPPAARFLKKLKDKQLKRLYQEAIDISEFQRLMDAASAWTKEVGMTEEDIASAIKTVRGRRKSKV